VVGKRGKSRGRFKKKEEKNKISSIGKKRSEDGEPVNRLIGVREGEKALISEEDRRR